MQTLAIIVAAGRGTRAATSDGPKQYAELGGRPVLAHTIDALLGHASIARIQVVIHADDRDRYALAIAGLSTERLLDPVIGGATRQASVLAGLEAVTAVAPDAVLIHDAARPFVAHATIDRLIAALGANTAAIAALPLIDTLKRSSGSPATIAATVDRRDLWRAQTPQAFRYPVILDAHRAALRIGRDDYTDDAAVAEAAGHDVVLVEGAEDAYKITTPADLARARKDVAMSGEDRTGSDRTGGYRTGSGFDVHAFTAGDHVWLCGLRIAADHALAGHSDADVAMHALTDALYGALAEGDIGAHFPPSEPQWKGAASDIFLGHARDRVAARGGAIVNVDVTIICEVPKIGPHRDAMRARLADILRLDVGRVAVKATTTEGLGFTGRREGIAAMASATIRLPS